MNRNNTENPYAITDKQRCYPSQNADYLSLDVGGVHTKTEWNVQQYQDRQFNKRGYCRGPSNRGRNREFQRQPYKEQHKCNYGSHLGKNTNKPSYKGNVSSMYFHPSMLQDPWKELIERLHAIHRSAMDTPNME